MIALRSRFIVSVLCVATASVALGLATTAADAAPKWRLAAPGEEVKAPLAPALTAKAETALTLTSKISGVKSEFTCGKVTLDSTMIEAEGKGTGSLLFGGCQTLLNGTLSSACEPLVGAEEGAIASNPLKSQLVLHEGATLNRIEAKTAGGALGTIHMGEECSIGELVPVIGVLYVKDGNGRFEAMELGHLLAEGPLTELWAISKTAEHKATPSGSVLVSLSGEHLHREWQGLGSKSQWRLAAPGEEVKAPLAPALTGKAETALTLTTKISGVKTEFTCGKVTLVGALLEAEGKGSGSLSFGGCQTLLNGSPSKACEPSVGAEKGAIASGALKSQLVLHEGMTLNRIEAKTGGTLGTIHMSEECSIGETVPVSGVLYAKESNGRFEAMELGHLLEEGPLTAMWVISNTPEHKAILSGSVLASLIGEHQYREWNGLGSKSQWRLAAPGEEVKAPLAPALTAKAETALTLTTKISGTKSEFTCGKVTLDSALLEAEGKGTGSLLFGGCQTLLNGTPSSACEPRVGAEKGAIASNALKSQLVLHEGATLDRIEAKTGETLSTIEMGEECAIGEKVPVIGVLYVKDGNGRFEAMELGHLLSEGPLTELWAISKTAEHKAPLSGSVLLSLGGEHLYREWQGLGN